MATRVEAVGTALGRVSRLWRRPARRGARIPYVPSAIVGLLLFCAIFANVISPHHPRGADETQRERVVKTLVPPFQSWDNILGTDRKGLDILSRMIHGARTSAIISLIALGSGVTVGTVLGLVAGYRGGWVDAVIMRLVDAALAFPLILVALLIVVVLGPGIQNIILAIAATVWARFARQVRGEVLSLKGREFVTLAKIAGVPEHQIIIKHIFPNVVNTLLIVISLQVGQVILTEASLSFLGLGLPPGDPAWGIMVAEGRNFVIDAWWMSLFPGIAITMVVLAFNFFGDWLRDTLDPKLRRI
ncbi:MAG: ABC transporter permease [Dehalococcoidia bacterium]|nr:ABC transporter permease [Dehalococcoidia bacterium]MSQ16721.1 ABC transporter permease [Dehalococcoidia bacterium]